MSSVSPFSVIKKNINANININIITIESVTPEFKLFMDNSLISIYLGNRNIDLSLTKQKLFNFLNTKSHNTKMGAIAEFFIHLYVRTIDMKQECLMGNLEEGSIKKGFDGYYSQGDEEWIMESKSGTIDTSTISHHAKISEAYRGLKSLLSGGSPNNPWENAYNHASHRDTNTRDTIIKNIEKFSNDFDTGIFYEIKNFNIIPSSTIFYNGIMSVDTDEILEKLESLVGTFEYQKLEIICISKKSLDLFIDYLNDRS
jgi:hypothetical protein